MKQIEIEFGQENKMRSLIKDLEAALARHPSDPTDIEIGYSTALQHMIILIKEKYLKDDKRTSITNSTESIN